MRLLLGAMATDSAQTQKHKGERKDAGDEKEEDACELDWIYAVNTSTVFVCNQACYSG